MNVLGMAGGRRSVGGVGSEAEALGRAKLAREIGAAVFPQEGGDLTVAGEVEGRGCFHDGASRAEPETRRCKRTRSEAGV